MGVGDRNAMGDVEHLGTVPRIRAKFQRRFELWPPDLLWVAEAGRAGIARASLERPRGRPKRAPRYR